MHLLSKIRFFTIGSICAFLTNATERYGKTRPGLVNITKEISIQFFHTLTGKSQAENFFTHRNAYIKPLEGSRLGS